MQWGVLLIIVIIVYILYNYNKCKTPIIIHINPTFKPELIARVNRKQFFIKKD